MFSKLNSKPINYNPSRRLPKNCCLFCGTPLGNFNPLHAIAIGSHSGRFQGWICVRGCPEDEDEDEDDDEYVT